MALLINGTKVEDAVIHGEMQRLGQGQQQLGLQDNPTASTLEKIAKDNIIERVLLAQEVDAASPEVSDAEVDDELNKTTALYGGQSAFLNRNNMSEDDLPKLRQRIHRYLQTNKLLEKNCQPAEPTENEVQTYFEENQARYQEPAQVRVSHIVKRAQGDQKDRVYSELKEIRNALLDGADFGELAEKNSECTDEPKGDLGFFPPGKMVEAFETVVFSMREGEISPVFSTEFGYHIAKVTGFQEERSSDFEDVREQVLQDIRQKRRSEARTQYLQSVREKSEIEEIEDKSDTEAAERETKAKSKKKKK